MAQKTVEDLEDNIWYRSKCYKNTEILQEKLSTFGAKWQTPVSSYVCVLSYP